MLRVQGKEISSECTNKEFFACLIPNAIAMRVEVDDVAGGME